jgi:GST-like protein
VIELHYWPTPNGHKITIFLEEAGVPYKIVPVNIGKGEQFKPDFLRIAPNNRMPAIIDDEPAEKGGPVSVFESGAILQYLAEKTGKFLPKDLRGRYEVRCSGSTGRWVGSGRWPGRTTISRFTRRKSCLTRSTATSRRPAGSMPCSTSDSRIANSLPAIIRSPTWRAYPWIVPYERQGQKLEDYPNLKRWFETIKARPATIRAYEKGKPLQAQPVNEEERRKIMFGQSAATVQR